MSRRASFQDTFWDDPSAGYYGYPGRRRSPRLAAKKVPAQRSAQAPPTGTGRRSQAMPAIRKSQAGSRRSGVLPRAPPRRRPGEPTAPPPAAPPPPPPRSTTTRRSSRRTQPIEDPQKKKRLDQQYKMERDAESRGQFAKKQRVRYLNKSTGKWYNDAFVAGVHYDDGPDQPYYTIKYNKNDAGDEPDFVEKQTTPDRLEPLPWDPNATWEILNQQ